jgi:adenosylhomocysteine nucleosidase
MINIVVALPAEARPLLDHFRLRDKQADTAFPVYRNTGMALIVAGPGKVAAAAATAVLAGSGKTRTTAAWLNIGIAGHAHHAIGSGYIAHRITDNATGTHWYPPQILDLSIPTDNLCTVDRPEDNYPAAALYEMEASGFFPVACRFSSSELVQCFKVISDNRAQPTTAVTAKLCEQLISGRLADIDQLVKALADMADEYASWHASHPDLEQLSGRWRFTVSQQHQLDHIARRWKVLAPEQPLWLEQLDRKQRAADVLQCLQQHLDTMTASTA